MNKIRKAAAILRTLRTGCRTYGIPFPTAAIGFLDLYFRHQFSPKEILGYGMYVPEVRARNPVTVSKEGSLRALAKINPPQHHWQTENKAEFYRLCMENGLPIPQYFGHAHGDCAYDAQGRPISGADEWATYLQRHLPANFITKDLAGAYGTGLRVYERSGNQVRDIGSGQDLTIPQLITDWTTTYGRRGFVLQERLFDAGPLRELCGRPTLQSMRVNTEIQENGDVAVLFYWLKIVAGPAFSDNFSGGATGNLAAWGNRETGVLEGAMGPAPSGTGLREVDRHPVSGVPIRGFPIPFWKEAIETCRRAQACFPALPNLGWDVALTDDGPRLLEANARWGPPIYIPHVMSDADWVRLFGKT